MRAGKGWRGRRELAPRRSATRISCIVMVHRQRFSMYTRSAPPPPHTTTPLPFLLSSLSPTTTTSVAILAQVILAAGDLSCAATAKLSRFTILPSTNWRTKTTRTTSLHKKLVCTATIGGSVRTQLVPIRCQSGIELTSSKHNFATAQTPRRYSSSATMEKLFLILVELARILVAFFL